jgi:hypothetical protein
MALIVLGSLSLFACKTSAPGAARVKDAAAAPLPCLAAMDDVSGAPTGLSAIAGFDDPIASLVLRGTSACPTTLAELFTKLADVDADGCSSPRPNGIGVVSENAQLLGKPGRYRTVFTRTCHRRAAFELFLAPLTSFEAGTPAPADVEIMAFDRTAKLYHFYALEGGRWRYFGSSLDMLAGPGGGAFPDQERRCANCHAGGGPVMKELVEPWINWQGGAIPGEPVFHGIQTPGASQALGKTIADLGLVDKVSPINGPIMQRGVLDGTRAWTPTRVKALVDKGALQDILRPLFCTMEMNVQTEIGATPPDGSIGAGGDLRSIPSSLILHPSLGTGETLPVTPEAYRDAIVLAKQRMIDDAGAPLTNAAGAPLIDTVFDFIHPVTASADNSYLNALRDEGIIDEAITAAVAGVDLTRPLFSKPRCELLKRLPVAAPETPWTAASVRQALASSMAGPDAGGGAAAELRQNLEDPTRATKLAARLEQACAARAASEPKAFMVDMLKLASSLRGAVRKLPIFEHNELFPVDSLGASDDLRLDPQTCTLL